jgi:hypothetical protein
VCKYPHRGFETVTYMIDGIFQHQDSNGGGGLITDGDTQWMTAGAELSLWRHEYRRDQYGWSRIGAAAMCAGEGGPRPHATGTRLDG